MQKSGILQKPKKKIGAKKIADWLYIRISSCPSHNPNFLKQAVLKNNTFWKMLQQNVP